MTTRFPFTTRFLALFLLLIIPAAHHATAEPSRASAVDQVVIRVVDLGAGLPPHVAAWEPLG